MSGVDAMKRLGGTTECRYCLKHFVLIENGCFSVSRTMADGASRHMFFGYCSAQCTKDWAQQLGISGISVFIPLHNGVPL